MTLLMPNYWICVFSWCLGHFIWETFRVMRGKRFDWQYALEKTWFSVVLAAGLWFGPLGHSYKG